MAVANYVWIKIWLPHCLHLSLHLSAITNRPWVISIQLLWLMVALTVSLFCTNQSCQYERDEYDQSSTRGGSWFRPSFSDDGFRRGKMRNRRSQTSRRELPFCSCQYRFSFMYSPIHEFLIYLYQESFLSVLLVVVLDWQYPRTGADPFPKMGCGGLGD